MIWMMTGCADGWPMGQYGIAMAVPCPPPMSHWAWLGTCAALESFCMKAHHEMEESTRGFLVHFALIKDYFLYLVAFKRGLWLNHRNGYFPKCLPFVE